MKDKSIDCPHCGQDLRLSPDAKDEQGVAYEKGYLAALNGPEVKALIEAVDQYLKEKEHPVPDHRFIFDLRKRMKEAIATFHKQTK